MIGQGTIKALCFTALACASVLACSTTLAVEPPGWWENPNRGTAELLYEKGSSGKCPTEEAARQKAWDDGLATIRKQITPDTNLWPWIQLAGTDIAFESIQEDAEGGWYAWLLVSYPRDRFETALRHAGELAKKAQERIPVFVPPVAFGRAEEQFPEVVEKYKARGYDKDIWQTLEALLSRKGFEVVTAPSSHTKDMQSAAPATQTGKLPDTVLLCNMDVFEFKTEEMSWDGVRRNNEYHVELLLEWYEATGSPRQVRIPAKGEARDKDVYVAMQKATEQAVSNLMKRIRGQ